MASCRACGLWMSAKDDRCPHCGRPNLSAANYWKGHLLYSLCEITFWVFMFFVLGHSEQPRNSATKWIIPYSFPAHDGTPPLLIPYSFPVHGGAPPLPANTLLNDPPWPLVPFPNE
jgi:hypothetical protein